MRAIICVAEAAAEPYEICALHTNVLGASSRWGRLVSFAVVGRWRVGEATRVVAELLLCGRGVEVEGVIFTSRQVYNGGGASPESRSAVVIDTGGTNVSQEREASKTLGPLPVAKIVGTHQYVVAPWGKAVPSRPRMRRRYRSVAR